MRATVHPKSGQILGLSYRRIHRLLRRLDDLRDHRHPHQPGPRSKSDPIRPARRHADPHWVAYPCRARHLGRSLWGPGRPNGYDARRRRRDISAIVRRHLSRNASGGARRRHHGRLLRRRRSLRLALVSGGTTGDGTRHLRCRKCRRRNHERSRSLRARHLRLADGRAGLGGGLSRHGGHLLVHGRG